MIKNLFRLLLFVVPALLLGFLLHSCANRGAGPQGGPKDTIPPRILKSIPERGILNFNKQKIETINQNIKNKLKKINPYNKTPLIYIFAILKSAPEGIAFSIMIVCNNT